MDDLIQALKHLKVQTGSFACLGCGHEHSCSVHGCAIIQAAIEELEKRRWIAVNDRMPDPRCEKRVIVFHKDTRRVSEAVVYADGSGFYSLIDCVSLRPAPKGSVTHWMPLPEPPKEKPDEKENRPDA